MWLTQSFSKDPTLLELSTPLYIVGDLHGQLADLLEIFREVGWPNKNRKFLFLGDYVDRTQMGTETFALISLLKLLMPDSVYMIRGNHEDILVNKDYNFSEELYTKYDDKHARSILNSFSNQYKKMSLTALLDDCVLCMHGGISEKLTSINQLRRMEKMDKAEDGTLQADLLWADPHDSVIEWNKSPRNISQVFNQDALKRCCEMLGVEMILRAHEVVQNGCESFGDEKLLWTIFSAGNYTGRCNNLAAVAAGALREARGASR
uniref:Serine/threonine-protein phosphatase n=1 Tax=Dermatophagoides pteronyssinus TaxID=6956 RepID=A0A6P6Y7F2_DERPT|nr:serine/threonine-protein phosphatase PP1-delta-like [Dermatophagoides pteronyssinus]